MRRTCLILSLLWAGVAHGQAIEVSLGSSTLFQGTGGGATAYFPRQTIYLGGGIEHGQAIVGVSDAFNYRGYGVTLGDKLFGFGFDGTGLSLVNRGITVERRSEGEQVTAFVGSSGFGYYAPFFQANSPRNFGVGLFLQKRIGKLRLSSLEVIDGSKKTASEGFSYQQKTFKLAGSGGVLNGARFLNGLADLEPASWIRFSAAHQNYFWPQRSTFDSLSVFSSFGHFTAQASALDGSSQGRKIIGESVGAGIHFAGFSEHSDWYRSNQQNFLTHTALENFRRVNFSQTFTRSSGKNSLAFGGGFHSNALSVTVSQSVLFFAARGFRQVTTIQVSFRVPHTDASVNLGVNVGPQGTPRYTASSTDYFYGNSRLFSGNEQPRSIGKYFVRGIVSEESGEPVFGAVLRIGKATVITDSRGAFMLRSKKRSRVPFAVVTAEFLAGNWTAVDAPAFVTFETEGQPSRVVVKRTKGF